jgi:hypothetical protein
MCLLKPAPPEIMGQLQAPVAFLKKKAATEHPWMCILIQTSLALHELRAGNPADAIVRADQALVLVQTDPMLDQREPPGSREDYQAFHHSVILMACRQTGDATRAAAEKEAVEDYLRNHGEEFTKLSPSEDTLFLPVVERALAMILAREALGAE